MLDHLTPHRTKLFVAVYGLIASIQLFPFIAHDIAQNYGGDLAARGTGRVVGALFIGYLIYSVFYFLFRRFRNNSAPFSHIPPLIIGIIFGITALIGSMFRYYNIYLIYRTEILGVLAVAVFFGFLWNTSTRKHFRKEVIRTSLLSGFSSPADSNHEDDEVFEEPDDKKTNADEKLETAQDHSTTRRLRVLKNLLNEGLISENDYNTKKKKILDDL